MPVSVVLAWDRVHPDAIRSDFLGEPDGEAVDRALGCGVVHVFTGAAGRGGDRRDVNDDPAVAARRYCHPLDRRAGAVDRAKDIHREGSVQGFVRQRGDGGRGADHAGVVDQQAHPSQPRVAGGEERVDIFGPRDIRPDRDRPGTGRLAIREDRGGACGVFHVVDADVVTVARCQARRGRANAPPAAGDDRDFLHALAPRDDRALNWRPSARIRDHMSEAQAFGR